MNNVPEYNKNRIDNLKKSKGLSPLAYSLLDYLTGSFYSSRERGKFLIELEKSSGIELNAMESADQFFCADLRSAITEITSPSFAEDIRTIIDMTCKCQFSFSIFRKSYGSGNFKYHAMKVLYAVKDWVLFYFYEQSVEELLLCNADSVRNFDDFIALEINKGNHKVIDTLQEMILGDNNVLISSAAISGIIRSEHQGLKDLLMKLLVAAKNQEGIRQSILHAADGGTLETFRFFLKGAVDHDLFRFSGAARSFYVWTGLYNEDIDIAFTRKMANVAWECLSDPTKRALYLESENPFEIYLAVWATGCEELSDTEALLNKLLRSEKTHKRLLAWYFILRVENAAFKHSMAEKYMESDDLRLLGISTDCLYIVRNLTYVNIHVQNKYIAEPKPDTIYSADLAQRRALFEKLHAMVLKLGKKSREFKGYLFPWTNMVVDNDHANMLPCMMGLAQYDLDDGMIDTLHDLMEYMNVDRRMAFYARLLQPECKQKHREYILEGLKDKSISVKTICIRKLLNCQVQRQDIETICSMFSTRSGQLKKLLMNYLTSLDTPNKEIAIDALIRGGENHIQAAIELMLGDASLQGSKEKLLSRIEGMTLSDQTQILFKQLFPEPVKDASCDEISEWNGYGLFDRQMIAETVKTFSDNDEMGRMSEQEILALFPSASEQERILDAINAVIEAHRDYEYSYINYADERVTVLLGDSTDTIYTPEQYGKHNQLWFEHKINLDMLPFAEEFRAALGDLLADKKKLAALSLMGDNSRYGASSSDYHEWFYPFINKYYAVYDKKITEKYQKRIGRLRYVVDIAFNSVLDDELTEFILNLYLSLVRQLGRENYAKPAGKTKRFDESFNLAGRFTLFVHLRSMFRSGSMGDETFAKFFRQEYALEKSVDYAVGEFLEFEDYVRAVDLNLITQDHFCDWILYPGKNRRRGKLSILTTLNKGYGKQYAEKYPWFQPLSEKMVDRLVRFEAKRGQADTPVSSVIRDIHTYKGTEYFVLLLQALGSEKFYRGYVWGDCSKQANLSILLKKCYPDRGETAETLKNLLAGTNIKEKRLVEAAMYAPQWASFMETITGWKGLKKAIWFFHAHISEEFSSEKETEVALYSPITPQQFNDGLFDAAWFRESYEELGEKRFVFLHKYAKYITSGSNTHKRSQLFADAAMGRLDEQALEQEIREKRNQERIRAYAILPLRPDDKAQLLHRYEFITAYQKESRQFGAQRREHERKAGAVALENLAVSCGLFDVNRMLWKLEREKIKEIQPLLEKRTVQGYNLWLKIDSEGTASVQCEKAGKALKTMPKALAKDEYAALLKQKVKELKDQKQRSRESLENAMIDGTGFRIDEVMDLLDSPTISPMACRLVWTDGGNMGFPEKRNDTLVLCSFDGSIQPMTDDSRLMAAHPYHLACSGHWHDYMHLLYEKGIVQPFKQVFREYYPITDEERDENTVSRRYAGYQVQPSKTAALLKKRGWTVDYEEGWQKVNYQDDLVVHLYSYADWFTPADIEAPTLEEIKFYNRRTDDPVPLSDINPICFSEIMRDLDLVVSTAYVGGVDAETSHSTIEMRNAIAQELCQLFRLKNVEFLGKHAKVHGKLGEYSIHLGSGIVHASGKGAVHILPVHSQHRGRIFLPFADDDPKTAEIMSKILLLAEDHKIKDPTILSQL